MHSCKAADGTILLPSLFVRNALCFYFIESCTVIQCAWHSLTQKHIVSVALHDIVCFAVFWTMSLYSRSKLVACIYYASILSILHGTEFNIGLCTLCTCETVESVNWRSIWHNLKDFEVF